MKTIKGKHLGKVESLNLRTGEITEDKKSSFFMLPAPPDKCQECAVDHDPTHPHNAQSLFYQYKFYNEHGKWPNWLDAMSHCDDKMKADWTEMLEEQGVDVKGGKVNP